VRINDRRPITPGRVIDLSYKAAELLQFSRKGIEKVRLDLIDLRAATVLTAENLPH
jgi:rare lipoprotein A